MKKQDITPVLGCMVAIIVTGSMDIAGLGAYSALPLFLLWIFFSRMPATGLQELGFSLPSKASFVVAFLYPLLVIGIVGSLALVSGAASPDSFNLIHSSKMIVLVTVATIITALVTEEAFFRGWLFKALQRKGYTNQQILIGSRIAFMAWHISGILWADNIGQTLPPEQIPVFLINALLIGYSFGLMRQRSGSLLIPAISHGLWNGLAYELFGFGTKTGALEIKNTIIWSVETGIAGVLLNLCFLISWILLLRKGAGS